jgi:hypothetical protein
MAPSAGWRVVAATTDGTAGAEAPEGVRRNGFEKTAITQSAAPGSECDGRSGAVSAVVLSFSDPVTLDPGDSPHDIIRVVVAGETPPQPGDCTDGSIAFVDGCICGAIPIANTVMYQGRTVQPFKLSLSMRLCARRYGLCLP